MKYNIIASVVVFLFLTACNPDFNTHQKDVKYQSNKKRLNTNQEANTNQEVAQKYHTTNSDELIIEGVFADLKLTTTENSMLNDMKRRLQNEKDRYTSLFENNVNGLLPEDYYNEAYFDRFFLSLGSARSKKLIKLFCRIEKEQNRIFEAELVSLWLYIRELYSPNIKYSDEVAKYVGGHHFSRPSIDQQYEKIKTQLEHTLNFV
ncbi:P52 family lipoprotein [Borreliella bavariensis]|uniref:P52 family lipoprotein n=1 Tax=Borreliella bavariensis TaxID=664662 RepID=UPI001C0026E9|nr:P52 family lipoprotein [Borreliella bavariensis]